MTARLVEGRFILEFKREYRSPLSVGPGGELYLRGESTGLSVGSLTLAEPDEDNA